MKFRAIVFLTLILSSATFYAQNVSITNDASDPDPSAMLDIKSTERGLLIPRMLSSERIAITAPADGLLVYDIITESFWYFNGFWTEIKDENDAQTLSIGDHVLQISNGNFVTLPDNQALSISGNNLTIENGNTVTLPAGSGAGDKIEDADGDTRIVVEETPDEDIIKVYTGPWSDAAWQFVDKRLEPLYGYEVKIGFEAGLDMGETPFARNTLVGYKAGRDITPLLSGGGSFNSCFGNRAGTATTTGENNLFLGSSAGQIITSGSENTLLGTNSGGNAQGSGNVFIGYSSGYNANGDNQLIIQNTNSSIPLIYGEFDNQLFRINGTIEIGDEYAFPAIDGSNGEVMTTDGAGNVIWTTPSAALDNQTLSISGDLLSISNGNSVTLPLGSGNSDMIEDTDGDTRISVEQNPDEDIVKIYLADGANPKFQFNQNRLEYPGGNTLRIGTNAGSLQTSDGQLNTFLGNSAGASNVSGNYNTLIGYEAGMLLTGTSNTLVGTQAGNSITSGSSNTIFGDYAGQSISTASNNTFIGENSGGSATGSGNVFLGRQSGTSESGDNKLYIENSSSNSPLIYGEFDNDFLQINGELNIGGNYSMPNADGTSGQIMVTDGTGIVTWENTSLGVGAFATGANVTSNTNGDYANDDFVFGSPQLDDNGSPSNDFRIFFDKSKGAFRAGAVGQDQWDETNLGTYSFASGRNSIAKGASSIAHGDGVQAIGSYTVAIGYNTIVDSRYGIAFGKFNVGGNTTDGLNFWVENDPLFEIGVGQDDNNRANAFTILKSGRVIIGEVTDLSTPIGDGYDLVVDGKMLCEEIKVQDSGSWPDFVFEEDYDLMDLEEVALFIEENNHLPGVPSAAEVNGKGFELGEMNEILLKKIEELTLYVLELQKEIDAIQTK